jgi:hypothetical protein
MDARTRNLTMYLMVRLGCLMLVRTVALVAIEQEIQATQAILFGQEEQ